MFCSHMNLKATVRNGHVMEGPLASGPRPPRAAEQGIQWQLVGSWGPKHSGGPVVLTALTQLPRSAPT